MHEGTRGLEELQSGGVKQGWNIENVAEGAYERTANIQACAVMSRRIITKACGRSYNDHFESCCFGFFPPKVLYLLLFHQSNLLTQAFLFCYTFFI